MINPTAIKGAPIAIVGSRYSGRISPSAFRAAKNFNILSLVRAATNVAATEPRANPMYTRPDSPVEKWYCF